MILNEFIKANYRVQNESSYLIIMPGFVSDEELRDFNVLIDKRLWERWLHNWNHLEQLLPEDFKSWIENNSEEI